MASEIISKERATIIDSQATEVLRSLGYNFEEGQPINIVKAATTLGFFVGTAKMPKNEQGFIAIDNENKIKAIGLNESCGGDMKRFVLAHELGHFFLHAGDSAVYLRVEKENKEDIEQEADLFAACLLMPKEVFKKRYERLKNEKYSDNVIASSLALSFKVPYESARRRIYEVACDE